MQENYAGEEKNKPYIIFFMLLLKIMFKSCLNFLY